MTFQKQRCVDTACSAVDHFLD